MDDLMLTTVDNPWNPFKDFKAWLNYDLTQGYNTCGILANYVKPTSTLPDNIEEMFVQDAMNTITREDFKGFIIKVSPESYQGDKIVPVP